MSNYSRRQFLRDSSLVAISISPFVGGILFSGCKTKPNPADFKGVKSFRLTIPESLFNAEFYFINCAKKGGKIYAKYSQEECYMVVRLPQQHIAEQNFGEGAHVGKAASAISGYSYITFQIVFQPKASNVSLSLEPEQLLDWNNEISSKEFEFKLVVKKGHSHSLFEKYPWQTYQDTIINGNNTLVYHTEDSVDNSYPLNYKDNQFVDSLFPKADGRPITAIEAPWRLIMSPKLSDEERYSFHWEFSKKAARLHAVTEVELWMATLLIKDNPSFKKDQQHSTNESGNKEDKSEVKDLEKKLKAIELMLIGSPDLDSIRVEHPTDSTILYKPEVNKDSVYLTVIDPVAIPPNDTFKINLSVTTIPSNYRKAELVTLYIKYKLLARTEKIGFTPLGISTFIDFKNNDTENNHIDLVTWKHLISLGRDEEAEIASLLIDKQFGHKMLHIESVKRITQKGKSFLKWKKYIMPLELEKDYSAHNDYVAEDGGSNDVKVSKFNFPFKKAVFTEKDPKRIMEATDGDKGDKFRLKFTKGGEEVYAFIPLGMDGKPIEFEYTVTDWDNRVFKVTKSIQAIPYKIVGENFTFDDAGTISMAEKLDLFFNPPEDSLNSIDVALQKYKSAFTALSELQEEIKAKYNYEKLNETVDEIKRLAALPDEASDKISQLTRKYRNNVNEFKAQVDSMLNNKFNALSIDSIINRDFRNIGEKVEQATRHFNTKNFELQNAADSLVLDNIKKAIDNFETQVKTVFSEKQIELQEKYLNIKKDIEDKLNRYLWYDIFTIEKNIESKGVELKKSLTTLIDSANKAVEVFKSASGTIKLSRQNVSYAVKDFTEDLSGVNNNISSLETEFIYFKGKLKSANGVIDFFNEFASVPQLDIARVYIDKINKVVNNEIPINIKYAEDYIRNQTDLAIMEVKNNASCVFASVYENSRELVRSEMRKLTRDLGGIINPELPVELLTALKHPKETTAAVLVNLEENLPPGIKDSLEKARKYEREMIFISEEAKQSYNEIKAFKFQPGDFFKALDAKILGSIRLKDILGIDFNIPNVTYLHEEKKIAYNFITDKIIEKDLGLIKFTPNSNTKRERTKIQVYADKSWNNANEYSSFSRLNNFAISVKPMGGDLLKVVFDEIRISSSSQTPKNVSVKIDDVRFEGVLNFLALLAEKIKMPGTGVRIIPSFKGIEIGYSIPLPSISSPGFNFSNIKLDLALHVHFPSSQEVKPITISIGLNRPEDKFLLSVGIYGGRGHFVMEATPTKIISIDTAFEFGGVFALDVGIAQGQAFLMVGIRYQKDNYTGVVILTGYLTCGGFLTVYGFISISVVFIMLLEYNLSNNTLVGEAAVTYSVRVAFFKKSFTLRYKKVFKGTERNTEVSHPASANAGGAIGAIEERDTRSFEKYYTIKQWEEYLGYFEIEGVATKK